MTPFDSEQKTNLLGRVQAVEWICQILLSELFIQYSQDGRKRLAEEIIKLDFKPPRLDSDLKAVELSDIQAEMKRAMAFNVAEGLRIAGDRGPK